MQVEAHERKRLEQLCRTITRPALSNQRAQLNTAAQLEPKLKTKFQWRLTQQARWLRAGTLAELPDIDAQRQHFRRPRWTLEPGDAVAFHMLALHASSGTGPGLRRRVCLARSLGDDMRHALRNWHTSPPFPRLEQRLPDGEPIDDALFPVVWPA